MEGETETLERAGAKRSQSQIKSRRIKYETNHFIAVCDYRGCQRGFLPGSRIRTTQRSQRSVEKI
jgi:hypothetical protein